MVILSYQHCKRGSGGYIMQDHFVNKPHHAQLHGVACCTYDTGIGHLYTSHSLENPPKLIGKHFFFTPQRRMFSPHVCKEYFRNLESEMWTREKKEETWFLNDFQPKKLYKLSKSKKMNQNLALVYYALSLARIDVFQPGDKLALTLKKIRKRRDFPEVASRRGL